VAGRYDGSEGTDASSSLSDSSSLPFFPPDVITGLKGDRKKREVVKVETISSPPFFFFLFSLLWTGKGDMRGVGMHHLAFLLLLPLSPWRAPFVPILMLWMKGG